MEDQHAQVTLAGAEYLQFASAGQTEATVLVTMENTVAQYPHRSLDGTDHVVYFRIDVVPGSTEQPLLCRAL